MIRRPVPQAYAAAVGRRAAAAAGFAAVGCNLRPVGLLPLTPEEVPAHADVDEVPGQDLFFFPLADGKKVHIQADVGRRLFPAGIVPGLQPAVKKGPQPIGLLDQVRHPAVAAGQHALQIDHGRVVPAVADAAVVVGGVDGVVDRRREAQVIARPVHGRPLEGSECLGHEKGGADRDLTAPVPLLFGNLLVIGGGDLVGQI